ncbi:SAP domain-containing protein [Sporobolomyces salmoneus]|uniref:SAP domain-containing protein n=1 Tax=Sporobolomyces salmoneus TaxID=183962 RepID=UPI00316E7E60
MSPPPTPPSTIDPHRAILSNSPALHSLKRPQLVRLCKQFKLKANGKNGELVERLKGYGKDLLLLSEQQTTETVGEGQGGEGQEMSWDLEEGGIVSQLSLSALFSATEEDGADSDDARVDESPSKNGLSKSSSNTSLASTIRSAGTAVFRKYSHSSSKTTSSSNSNSTTTRVYPDLREAFARYPSTSPQKPQDEDENEKTVELEEFDHSIEGAIRRVTTHTTVDTSFKPDYDDDDDEEMGMEEVPKIPEKFIFGSPQAHSTTQVKGFNFEMKMSGSLLDLSTTTTSSAATAETGAKEEARSSNSILLFDELNRRALESRLDAERVGIRLAPSIESMRKGEEKEKKGMERVFEGKHKRVFDKLSSSPLLVHPLSIRADESWVIPQRRMDSITNHYSTKRLHPQTSSSRIASSSSSRALNASSSTSERPIKRIKPSTSTKQLVSALRDSGWTSSSTPSRKTSGEEKLSLKESIRTASSSLSSRRAGGGGGGKDGLERLREEREERKRKLELAKARRKSNAAAVAAGGGGGTPAGKRRRPVPVVGPKPTGSVSSTASSFLKSTFKRFTTTTAPPPSNFASSSFTSSSQPQTQGIPRFAIPTASSSSRAIASLATSSSNLSRTINTSPGKNVNDRGKKKFDLQESLKRPMKWRTHLSSGYGPSSTGSGKFERTNSTNSLLSPPAPPPQALPLARKFSARVANPALLSATLDAPPPLASSSSNERIVSHELASLPPAPTTPFTALSTDSHFPSSSINSHSKAKMGSVGGKKMVSTSSRKLRDSKFGGETGKGGGRTIEGLESKARRIRAVRKTTTAGKGARGREE